MRKQSQTLTNERPISAFLISYSDSSFSNPHQVVSCDPPQFGPKAFTFVGKEMDGLESKRHRAISPADKRGAQEFEYDPSACNWFVIGLKQRSLVREIRVSTRWFTGNQVAAISVYLQDDRNSSKIRVLERAALKADAEHEFVVSPVVASSCRVECYFDGGISRVHLFGEPADQAPHRENILEDAVISHVSNEHYGNPRQAVLGKRDVSHMQGWESARAGFGERALFHLKQPVSIAEIVVDTYMHVNNSPLSCHVFALNNSRRYAADELLALAPRWKITFQGGRQVLPVDIGRYILEQRYLQETSGRHEKFTVNLELQGKSVWQPLLPFAALSRDTFHRFSALENCGLVTDVLFMYFPNGGIHGLAMYARQDPAEIKLNILSEGAARSELLRCSGSRRWADRMLERRPFQTQAEVLAAAWQVWFNLSSQDWMEGFASHPRIADVAALKKKFSSTAEWAASEQSGVQGASDDAIAELALRNDEYQEKFGYIFIVCATGKSAAEMLEIIRQRMKNAPKTELQIAAEEHCKITQLRLAKL